MDGFHAAARSRIVAEMQEQKLRARDKSGGGLWLLK
jgi:hypothetical protein